MCIVYCNVLNQKSWCDCNLQWTRSKGFNDSSLVSAVPVLV